MGTGTCWRCGASEDGSLAFCGDPRDAEIARLKVEMVNQRHEIGMLLGEIARLKAEVERLRDGFDVQVEAITRRDRAIAAGPAAVRRQENVDVNTREAYARVVEVAQAAAMKEKP